MSDDIRNLSATDIADIFGTSNQATHSNTPNFSGTGAEANADLFNNPLSVTDTTTVSSTTDSTTETTTLAPDGDTPDADILTGAAKPTPVEIKSLSDYYQDRLKNGTFVSIESEDEQGKKVQFIPQTPEDFDEVIQIQVDYRLDQAKKDMEKSWYEAKSPAWKAISQYAEMVDDPTQLIPFLQGVKNIQSVSTLDETNADQAEAIVRARMEQRGDPEEIIKSQIDALKSTDALLKTAQQVKPLMLQEEQRNLSLQIQEAKQQEQDYLRVINDIRENAHKSIELPIFGKTKLRQDEKALIYDMIAVPSPETQGYGIYSAIDKLFDSKDFETLKMVALLVGKKESFFQYLGADIANQTAAKLQKKLTVAGEMRGSSGRDIAPDDKPIVQRNQFSKQPRFGR